MLSNLSLNFRLFSFPIRIELSFLLIALLISFNSGLDINTYPEITLWVLVSILIHEFGHAFVGKAFGRNSRIRLFMMGGATICTDNPMAELSNFKNILMVIAGPFFGAAFGTILFLIYWLTGFVPHYFLPPDKAMLYILFINWGWSLLNLIPLFPLDGGQILYFLLRYIKGIDAAKISAYIAIGLGVVLVGFGLYFGEIWLAFMVGLLVFQNYQRLNLKDDEKLVPKMDQAASLLQSGRWDEASELVEEVLSEASSDSYKSWGVQMLGHIVLARKDFGALEALENRFPKFGEYFPEGKYELLKRNSGQNKAYDFALQTFPFHQGPGLVRPFFEALIAQGNFSRALSEYRRLSDKPWQGQVGANIALMLFQAGALEESAEVGRISFAKKENPDTAYNVACAYAVLGKPNLALEWLGKAVKTGFGDLSRLLTDGDLESLHELPEFQKLVVRLRGW